MTAGSLRTWDGLPEQIGFPASSTKRHHEHEAQNRAHHHRAPLREVNGIGHGPGDVEAERDKAIHGPEPEPGDDRRGEKHFAPLQMGGCRQARAGNK